MDARLVGHRLSIVGVGVFFGKPSRGEWRFTRHGRVVDPDQLGVIRLRAGEVELFRHGDFDLKNPVHIPHLRNIRDFLTKAGKLRRL